MGDGQRIRGVRGYVLREHDVRVADDAVDAHDAFEGHVAPRVVPVYGEVLMIEVSVQVGFSSDARTLSVSDAIQPEAHRPLPDI